MAGPCLYPLRPGLGVLATWPQRGLQQMREGSGALGCGPEGEAVAQLASGGDPSALPPPPCAPTLLQLAPSHPESSALLCPSGPPRSPLSPPLSLCSWPGSHTTHCLPAERSPCAGVHTSTGPGCSRISLGVHHVPEDAPCMLYARLWEPPRSLLFVPIGSHSSRCSPARTGAIDMSGAVSVRDSAWARLSPV